MSRIDDFGERIEGARKDAHQQWVENVSTSVESGLEGFISHPLSKSWPAPNYERLLRDNSMPRAVVDWMRSARDELGRKPGRYQVRGWAAHATLYLSAVEYLTSVEWPNDGNPSAKEVNERVTGMIDRARDEADASNEGSGISQGTIESTKKHLASIHARALCYEAWGHADALGFISFADYSAEDGYSGEVKDDKPFVSRVQRSVNSFPRRYSGHSWEEVIEQLDQDDEIKAIRDKRNAPESTAPAAPKRRKAKLSIIGMRGNPECSIAVKVKARSDWVKLETFPTLAAAREAFMDESRHEAWQAGFAQWRDQARQRTRNAENDARQGDDWRGGKDISPEVFSETFGFRGVQFGNYVENERRKDDLNDAYDALMDMASVLDISPKAISLDGTLGLAFGARGRGGLNPASAHYEPGHKVINLTKGSGAGSLAHEWFHAFDNYIADTALPETDGGGQPTYFTHAMAHNSYHYRGHEGLGVSDPIAQNLVCVLDILRARSLEMDKRRSGNSYWSQTIEIAARSFETGIKEALNQHGCRNDYLVNVLEQDVWDGPLASELPPLLQRSSYPYPKEDEKQANATHILAVVEAMCARSDTFADTFADYQREQQTERQSDREGQEQTLWRSSEPVTYAEQGQLFSM